VVWCWCGVLTRVGIRLSDKIRCCHVSGWDDGWTTLWLRSCSSGIWKCHLVVGSHELKLIMTMLGSDEKWSALT